MRALRALGVSTALTVAANVLDDCDRVRERADACPASIGGRHRVARRLQPCSTGETMDIRRVVLGAKSYLLVSVPLRQDARTEALSPSERAVARALVSGASNEMVAQARSTSIRTVANQVRAILARLRVSSRADLARTLGGVEMAQ